MISFHPTTSLITLARVIASQRGSLDELLSKRFQGHTTIVTDSGRSALAVIIEALSLSDKTLVLPAYLCNVILPVLERYNITPVFLDIDEHTFMPPVDAYTPKLLERADAVLLVATYGKSIPEEVRQKVCSASVLVIEDCAHCPLPSTPETLTADARLYSFPKTLPVPDGGLAILKDGKAAHPTKRTAPSLRLLKDIFKLASIGAYFVARLKPAGEKHTTVPTWHGIHRLSHLSEHLLTFFLTNNQIQRYGGYCYPFIVKNPERARKRLLQSGIVAERIWHNPIATAPEFVHTRAVAQSVLCVPLWHIEHERAYQTYIANLKHMLADELRSRRQK